MFRGHQVDVRVNRERLVVADETDENVVDEADRAGLGEVVIVLHDSGFASW
jgi:hypothetical protein